MAMSIIPCYADRAPLYNVWPIGIDFRSPKVTSQFNHHVSHLYTRKPTLGSNTRSLQVETHLFVELVIPLGVVIFSRVVKIWACVGTSSE